MKKKYYTVPQKKYSTLYALWQQFIQNREWVPLDRWLSHTMKTMKGLNQKEKLWLGKNIIEACRYGIVIAYVKFVQSQKDQPSPESGYPQDFFRMMENTAAFRDLLSSINSEDFFHGLNLILNQDQNIKSGVDFEFVEIIKNTLRNNHSLIARLIFNGISPLAVPFLKKRIEASKWSEPQINLFLHRHRNPSPLWLRLNRAETKDPVINDLKNLGFTTELIPALTLKVKGHKSIFDSESLKKGDFEIQDLASQKIGSLIGATAGQFLWDACAGGGGKTMQLASLLNGKGVVYASDINPDRLETLRLRARRNHLSNIIRVLPWQGEELPGFGMEIKIRQGFDAVLIDAPCSGSGTWRKNPDGKLFFNPRRTEELIRRQLSILSKAAPAVRPGGTIVYATCSIFYEENEGIIETFIKNNPAFSLLETHLFGNPDDDSDTTFAAKMKRE